MKPSRPGSSVMFFTFAAWTVGATAVSLLFSGAGSAGHAKFDQEKKIAEERCAAPQTDPWCTPQAPGTPVFALYRAGRSSLDRVATGRLNPAEEAAALARVIERAGVIERSGGTPVASLIAAKLIEEAGDRLDLHPSLLADEQVAHALAITDLESARHPFASERAHVLASLTKVPGRGRVPGTRLTEAATGAYMQRVDDTLAQMEKSALAGNVAACARAAEDAGPIVRVELPGTTACANADRVVHAGRRLAGLRVRASVAAAQRRPTGSDQRRM